MHVEPHHTADELADAADGQAHARAWRRIRGLVLARRGLSAQRIADTLGCTPRAVQNWVRRYNDAGLEGLDERPRPGRPPKFDPADHHRLRARIEAGPTPEDGTCTFYGPSIRRILRDEFGVVLSEQAVYDLLHRLGYSSLMPRPIHRKADPETQQAFKKAPPGPSPRSPRPTQKSGSRSGSPTRPDSGSKGR